MACMPDGPCRDTEISTAVNDLHNAAERLTEACGNIAKRTASARSVRPNVPCKELLELPPRNVSTPLAVGIGEQVYKIGRACDILTEVLNTLEL